MNLARWIDLEGRIPLFVAAGTLVGVFGFMGILATTSRFGVTSTVAEAEDVEAPSALAVIETSAAPAGGTIAASPAATPGDAPAAESTPASTPEAALAKVGTRHTIADGETLFGISRRYYGTGKYWREIAAANQLDGRAITLRTGQRLVLPPLAELAAQAAPVTSKAETVPNQETPPATHDSPADTVYTVLSGDTWWSISERKLGAGKEWKKLADANPKIDASRPLRVGEHLFIPK